MGKYRASLMAQAVWNPPAMQETQEMRVQFRGWEDSLKKEMATYFSILAWKILWTEDSGRLQAIGLQKLDTTEHACMGRYRQGEPTVLV